MINPEEIKKEKARNLRYKKAILSDLNLESIREELYEISEKCDEVRWIANGDEATLIAALDGDDEEAFEFRMAFTDLSIECERLADLLNEEYICECFDDYLTGISNGSTMRLIGYDDYEEDYFKLTAYEETLSCRESQKRIERLTKKELISAANQVFRVLICFFNVRYKFDYLEAAFDVLKGENTAFLDVIRQVEKEYEELINSDWNQMEKGKHFDELVSALPDRVWVE